MDLLLIHDPVTCHLENTESCRALKCAQTSLHNIKKITIVNITTGLIRKVMKNCQVYSGRYTFSKTLIFTWKFKFYLRWQILSVVFLEATGSLRSFLRKCLPSTQVWITTVCLSLVLSSKNDVLWKEALWAHTSNITQVLFLEMNIILQQQHKCFMCSSCSITQTIKKIWTRGSRFNKINHFYCFFKAIIKTDFFFKLRVHGEVFNDC